MSLVIWESSKGYYDDSPKMYPEFDCGQLLLFIYFENKVCILFFGNGTQSLRLSRTIELIRVNEAGASANRK